MSRSQSERRCSPSPRSSRPTKGAKGQPSRREGGGRMEQGVPHFLKTGNTWCLGFRTAIFPPVCMFSFRRGNSLRHFAPGPQSRVPPRAHRTSGPTRPTSTSSRSSPASTPPPPALEAPSSRSPRPPFHCIHPPPRSRPSPAVRSTLLALPPSSRNPRLPRHRVHVTPPLTRHTSHQRQRASRSDATPFTLSIPVCNTLVSHAPQAPPPGPRGTRDPLRRSFSRPQPLPSNGPLAPPPPVAPSAPCGG